MKCSSRSNSYKYQTSFLHDYQFTAGLIEHFLSYLNISKFCFIKGFMLKCYAYFMPEFH
jgi:hypothetical protein